MYYLLKPNCILDLTREEAYELMKDCVREIQKRLVINLPNFEVISCEYKFVNIIQYKSISDDRSHQLMMYQNYFQVRIVDKNGVSNMPDISVKTLEKSGQEMK